VISKIKLWLYGAAAGLIGLLFGWLKITQAQRDRAKVEAEKQAQARIAENAKANTNANILTARIKANQDAKKVEIENNAARGKRPSGNFGDKRMQ
jgi:hypothetical protein